MFSQNKIAYTNYKQEQVLAAADWLINAFQKEIPRINAIRKAIFLNEDELEKKLRNNLLNYGEDAKDDNVHFQKISIENQEIFKNAFVKAVWEICEFDAIENRMDYVHISCMLGEGCPEIQKALYSSMKEALISKEILENIFMGCYLTKNGTVDAYVKIGYSERAVHKDILEPKVGVALKN